MCRRGTIRNGDEGAKKLRGRTRHLLVNTQGMVMWAKVGSAAVQNRTSVPVVLEGIQEEFPRLE